MFSSLLKKFKIANYKLILLDYDGTLVDLEPLPEMAKPSLHLLDTLRKVVNQKHTEVIIISGRRHLEIDGLLGELPLDIIAEHGAMIKKKGKWKNQIIDDVFWKQSFLPIFNQFTLSCPNSFVEEKEFSLTWHYRNAQAELGHENSRELIRVLKDMADPNNLRIIDGHKIVEIMNNNIGKGKAVEKLLEKKKYDFILSIGDDQTDEDMFCALRDYNHAYTIKVGEGETSAKEYLGSPAEVIGLLNELIKQIL